MKELADLKKIYDEMSSSRMVFVMGRRRIGKTALVRKFLKDLPEGDWAYTYVDETSPKEIAKKISQDLMTHTSDPVAFDDMNLCYPYLHTKSKDKKFVLAIDEFQRLWKINKKLITTLQERWDNLLQHDNLMLILIGSAVGMIHRIAEGPTAPLYQRDSHKLHLKSFRYLDFREIFAFLPEEEIIAIYSVFGGTPYYVKSILEDYQKGKNLEQIIRESVVEKGRLHDLPSKTVSADIKSSWKYNSILEAISQGYTVREKIAQYIGEDNSGNLSYYLDSLSKVLKIIRVENPVLGKSKQAKYIITDPFFSFWYRYIFPNLSKINAGNQKGVMNQITSDLPHIISKNFESIVHSILKQHNGNQFGTLDLNFDDIGSWWDGEEEIDVCAPSSSKILLGEIKWRNKPMDSDVPKDLIERKSKYVGEKKHRKVPREYVMISKSGFTEKCINYMQEKDVHFFSLKDVKSLVRKKPIVRNLPSGQSNLGSFKN